MQLLIGIVIGLLISIFILIVVIVLKKPAEAIVRTVYHKIPKIEEKGGIIQAESDVAITQRKIIEDNKKAGRDTPLSEIIVE